MKIKRFLVLVLSAFPTISVSLYAEAQKSEVIVIDRQSSTTRYTYVLPGHSTANSNTFVNCHGIYTVKCSGSTTTTGTNIPPRVASYQVRGATLSLQLPDGRIAVVNCDSKYAPKFDHVNRRDCRMPLVNKIQAEFAGDHAKLKWPVSIDGKKLESETYKILAILDKPLEP